MTTKSKPLSVTNYKYKTWEELFPDKIVEKTKTEIYQRGVFGRLSRLK